MIMLGCPINRERFIEDYLGSILQLNYNLKDIRVVFLVNNARDNTISMLRYYKKRIGKNFASFEIHEYEDAPYINDNQRDYGKYADIRNKWLDLWDGEEYIFSIDSDIFIPSDSLNKLIDNDKDICSILIKNAPEGYNHYNFGKIDPEFGDLVRVFPTGELMEVDMTGAVYLIKNSVICSGVRYGPNKGGEDLYFCEKAKEKDFEIYCDTSIEAEHDMGDRYV